MFYSNKNASIPEAALHSPLPVHHYNNDKHIMPSYYDNALIPTIVTPPQPDRPILSNLNGDGSTNNSSRSGTFIGGSNIKGNNSKGVIGNHNNKRKIIDHKYHDHANDPIYHQIPGGDFHHSSLTVIAAAKKITASKRRGPRGGVVKPFPVRLHEMLQRVDSEGFGDVVSWQPHGRCFVIHNAKKFVDHVMPKYFNQSKFTSFQRQLNLYEFTRLTRGLDRGGYYHEMFLRGRPDLCKCMIRQRVKGTGTKGAYSPATEPNFYTMSPCNTISRTPVPRSKKQEQTSRANDNDRIAVPMTTTSKQQQQQQQQDISSSSLPCTDSSAHNDNVMQQQQQHNEHQVSTLNSSHSTINDDCSSEAQIVSSSSSPSLCAVPLEPNIDPIPLHRLPQHTNSFGCSNTNKSIVPSPSNYSYGHHHQLHNCSLPKFVLPSPELRHDDKFMAPTPFTSSHMPMHSEYRWASSSMPSSINNNISISSSPPHSSSTTKAQAFSNSCSFASLLDNLIDDGSNTNIGSSMMTPGGTSSSLLFDGSGPQPVMALDSLDALILEEMHDFCAA